MNHGDSHPSHRSRTARSLTLLYLVLPLLAVGLLLGACGFGGDDGDDDTDAPALESSETDGSEATETDESETETDENADEVDDDEALPVGAVPNIESLFTTDPIDCSFDEIIPLPVAPTCHEVLVPEDWANPDPNDEVVLQVAVFEGDGSHPDPIIYFDGGPGGHTLETLSLSFGDLVAPHLGGRDFVLFDQRGLGESEPSLHCYELTEVYYEELAGVITADEVPDVTFGAQDDCVERLEGAGINLAAYNSVASANDVEAIRLALGYEQLNPIGISYGTRLGQTYMRMYPDSVRSIVLDSVLPTGADLWTDFNIGAERAYRQLFEGCAASPGCATAYPNLEDDFFALLDQLDAEPVSLDLSNFITGQTIPSVLDGDDVMGLVFGSLYDQSLFSVVPQMTANAAAGNYEELLLLASVSATNVNYISSGMQLSVECNEELVFESEAARDATVSTDPRYQRIEAVAGSPNIFEACDNWPSGAAPDVEAETVESDIPTLLLGGQYDPITPPAGMDTIAAGLTTSYQFVFPHDGHGVAPTACGAEIVAAFIDDPNTEPDGSCIDQTSPPQWVPGEGGQATESIELVEFEASGLAAIKGLRPYGWNDLGSGVFTRGGNLTDVTTAMVQPTSGFPLETLVGILSTQLEVEFAANGTVDVDGQTWDSYLATDGDDVYELIGNGDIMVMLASSADERDTLRQQVLLPMAAAAEIP